MPKKPSKEEKLKAVEQAIRLPSSLHDPLHMLKKPALGGAAALSGNDSGDSLTRKLASSGPSADKLGKHTFTDLKGKNKLILKDNATRKR